MRMSNSYCDKRLLKKQDAISMLDAANSPILKHNSVSSLSLPETRFGLGGQYTNPSEMHNKSMIQVNTLAHSNEISIITVAPSNAPKLQCMEEEDKDWAKDTAFTPPKKVNVKSMAAHKISMESIPMLETTILKQPPKKNSVLINKILAFTKMRNNSKMSKTETFDSYVVDDEVHGPVCLIQDSPLRIFKCAQNGNVKEVVRILKSDPTRLHARNPQGQMPLHVAASKGHFDVVEVIVNEMADLDAVDSQGNTALHLAVTAGSPELVILLLKSGANVTIKNHAQMMPVHVASELTNMDVMTALLDNGANPNSRAESGVAPLHLAAAHDNGDMMRLLMARGAKPCQKCDFGYYPIHIAAKSAAANAMEAIIEQSLKCGYTREQILNFKDRENNLPLHSAVYGGNMKAVSVCLKAGASVKAQQEDGSTPLHFACSQGNMDMIKLMKDAQAENFMTAVFTLDAMKMTPLHRAALFNHRPVMEYLLNENADIDARDIHERTPLLLAASKGCWDTVQMLVARGAEMRVKDKNNRNFLHLAIKFGGKLKSTGGSFAKDMQQLLNERDDFGCTPLHYASKEGHLYALDDLIKMGAVLNLKDNHKQSPFHFAARYGRVNTCRRLLDSIHGPNLINETDGDGLSALLIAAQNGHTKIIQLLLERGAVVSKDHEDNTALHHASGQGWTHSMKIMLGVHQNLRDVTNIEGDTALHVAAKNGKVSAVTLLLTLGAKIINNKEGAAFFDYVIQMKHTDVAVAVVYHNRWEEVLQHPSITYGSYILGLIQHLPAVCINVLERCQVPSCDDPRSSKFHISYNFKFLEPNLVAIPSTTGSKDVEDNCPMMSLNAMVRNNRVDCLSHPVCITYLQVKWRRYGMWVYTAYLLVYIVFLSALTSFVVNENSLKHFDLNADTNETVRFLYGNHLKHNYSPMLIICLWIIGIYSTLNIIKEIMQIIMQKIRYFADIGNCLEWALYITSLLFVVPFLFGLSFHWQWEAGAVAVFLAWFNGLVFLQRFDFFGIYVVMFLEILRTLLQVLFIFSILIIAFGLSFYMLLFKEESRAYSTPFLSILRTFMMMLELDYMNSFNSQFVDGDSGTLHFGNLTLVLLTVFVLLMPILLMNLLIGLAVGDIESVQRDARLKRLAMQVELHINMERKMPNFLLKYVKLNEYKHFPNKCKTAMTNVFSMITRSTPDGECYQFSEMCSGQPSFVCQEMYKQKVRMRDMSSMLEKNNHLLRKIMEKMEIHTEEEAWDEGGGLHSDDSESEIRAQSKHSQIKSANPEAYLKSSVLDMWKGMKK